MRRRYGIMTLVKGLRRAATAISLAAVTALVTACSSSSGVDVDLFDTSPPSPSVTASQAEIAGAAYSDPRAVKGLLAAAARGFQIVNTFDYRELDKNLHAGLAVSTTPFANRYRAAFEGGGAGQVRAVHEAQAAKTNLVGIAGLDDSRRVAVVVVRGQLTARSTATKTPVTRSESQVLRMRRVGGTWRIESESPGTAATGTIPANAQLRAAVAAVRRETVRVFSLRRAQFAADFRRALAQTTGTARTSLQRRRGSLRDTLRTGDYDSSARITGLSAVSVGPTRVTFLARVQAYRIRANGTRSKPYTTNLAVTVSRVGRDWLLSGATTLA